jgi:hypothetical protein
MEEIGCGFNFIFLDVTAELVEACVWIPSVKHMLRQAQHDKVSATGSSSRI